jgi:hypothetical protein
MVSINQSLIVIRRFAASAFTAAQRFNQASREVDFALAFSLFLAFARIYLDEAND